MTERHRLAALTAALFFAIGPVPESVSAQVEPAPPRAAQQETATLSLGELLDLAREQSPRLKAALFRVDATRTREAEAGLLPDPTFRVGVANLALPEFSATMPASMVPSFQATQRFPIAGKRSLAEEIAHQSTEMDATRAEEVWWTVRTEAALGFYELYRLDRQAEVLRRTLGFLRDFEAVALSRYGAGTGPQADVLRAGVASVRMEADIERLFALRKGAASKLNALVSRPADTTVPSPELAPLPLEIPSLETLTGWALESRPALQGMQLAVSRAGSSKALAEKAIWPDLTVGLQYALGRMEGDPRSMGGASVGFSVPIHAGKRQKKLREEAAALERMTMAQLEDALASVNARVGQVLADLDRARTLLGLYQEEILPQARTAVESSLSSYRVGALDFMALIDAQVAVNRFEGEYFDLLASYGASVAQLEMTIGRDLPVSGNFILEIR
jgi:outer membrane protein TolC